MVNAPAAGIGQCEQFTDIRISKKLFTSVNSVNLALLKTQINQINNLSTVIWYGDQFRKYMYIHFFKVTLKLPNINYLLAEMM